MSSSEAPPRPPRPRSPGRPGRVTRRAEYLELSKVGRRVVSPHFVFLVRRSPEPGPGRLGITVTKKIAGAVGRNRWKRLIREAFRLHPELVPDGTSVVAIVRQPESSFTLPDVVAEWRGVLSRFAAKAPEKGRGK